MKKIIYPFLACMLLLVFFANPGWSLSSLRCGCCDILRDGDSALKVLECMGEPEFKTYVADTVLLESPTQSVQLEYWFYHQDDWVYQITIYNGIINDIKLIGRD